jgi:hypothetical protein
LDKTLAHPFLTGFSSAMHMVFFTGAAVLLLAILFSALIKETPLRTVSGQQARAAAEAAVPTPPVDRSAAPSGRAMAPTGTAGPADDGGSQPPPGGSH